MFQGLRDTPAGHFLRRTGLKSCIKYPEESAHFQAPGFPPSHDGNHRTQVEEIMSPKPIGSAMATADALPDQLVSKEASTMIVTWYTEEDPENPRNWSDVKKKWTVFVMCLNTFVVYCTASIITPTIGFVTSEFDISIEVASLGLSLYIAGYAVGPMVISPISEIPFVGRNPPYLYSFFIFFILSIIISKVKSFPALIVLRFFQGLFGSPALASGAATIEDMYSTHEAAFFYIYWSAVT
jgi:MFS transporter, DHA1 family, multidrug resistance protein